jgi:hypothetical protein
MYVRTVLPDEAEGAVKAMYERAQASEGYLPNQVQLFSLNPEARAAWRQLVEAMTATMDDRRYESSSPWRRPPRSAAGIA